MKYLLITPPFVQLNTPYPATAQLKAWLVSQGHEVRQCDLGIGVAAKIFCREFMETLFHSAFEKDCLSQNAQRVAMNYRRYLESIDSVWSFLKGEDDTLATRICRRDFLPEGSRFKNVSEEDLEWGYGINGTKDRAKHLSTLYISDLAEFIAEVYDCDFSLVRYEEQIAITPPSFDEIYHKATATELTVVESLAMELFEEEVETFRPDIVGMSIPFPGTLMMALRFCIALRERHSAIRIAMGGGYVNTELRSVSDVRLFEFIDYLLFDDGELPLESVAKVQEGDLQVGEMVRTKYLKEGRVVDSEDWESNVEFELLPAPDYSDLMENSYVSLVELTNPMHKLWSDGRWNKLTMAHGCYWAKCTFCDTNLDYISRFDAPTARSVVDRMIKVKEQTGISGFHFTDEAMPPALLRRVCRLIIDEGLVVSFWGNIRFEKIYDSEFAELLAKAGCIAVSGGLEVASPRVLKLINKGVTLEQAVECCANLSNVGIMVHTYLMYGFPTQSTLEAVDSLEVVRQMFELGIVQSAFWHRYAMTVHSKSGSCPQKFGARLCSEELNSFANNGVEYEMVDGAEDSDWEHIGGVMNMATSNYMLGRGYEIPLKSLFGKKYAAPSISKNLVNKIVSKL